MTCTLKGANLSRDEQTKLAMILGRLEMFSFSTNFGKNFCAPVVFTHRNVDPVVVELGTGAKWYWSSGNGVTPKGPKALN
jgi:hypothetical protein